MDGPVPAWRIALQELPTVRHGRWAVGGSASLALHGLAVEPGDVDLLADEEAAAELIDGLGDAVVTDDAPWDRGDVRATRRALAVAAGVEVEILVGVEAVSPDGRVVMTTPRLDQVESMMPDGRPIPVLPLSTMAALLEATGRHERAAVVREALEQSHGRRRMTDPNQ